MDPVHAAAASLPSVTGLSPTHVTQCCERLFEEWDDLYEMGGERALDSFVARIWLEHEPNGEAMWRGHIQHVQSGRESYFQDLGEMREFLERVTGVPGPAAERAAETDATIPEPGGAVKKERND